MIKLDKKRRPPQPPPTPPPPPPAGLWFDQQTEALRVNFDERLDRTRERLMDDWAERGEYCVIDLRRELSTELWQRLLRAFLRVPAGAEADFPWELAGLSEVRIEWELSADDDDRLLAVLYAGQARLGVTDWDGFMSEAYWTSVAYRWLIHEFCVEPAIIRRTLKHSMPRSEKRKP